METRAEPGTCKGSICRFLSANNKRFIKKKKKNSENVQTILTFVARKSGTLERLEKRYAQQKKRDHALSLD